MFGLTSDPITLIFIVMIDVLRHGMLLSMLNGHVLVGLYREDSSRVLARVDIAVEICLTIMTDAVGAAVTLVVVPIQMFGINQESFVFFQLKGCTSMGDDLRTPLYVVSLSLFFKLVLFTGVRFIVLRDQTIDMVNILHYLINKWSWIVLAQLVSSACIVYILLLNQSGVDIVSDVLSRNCTVVVIE